MNGKSPIGLSETITSAESLKRQRFLGASGEDSFLWNHNSPMVGLDGLVPSLLNMDKIELFSDISDLPESADQVYPKLGVKLTEVPFAYYRESTYVGRNRALDNSDLIKGKEPLYGDLKNMLTSIENNRHLVKKMERYYEHNPSPKAKCELEDLQKITIQQWKPCGFFKESTVASQPIPSRVVAQPVLDAVAKHYMHMLRKKYPNIATASALALRDMDDDPSDTLSGMPTCQSGAETIPARLDMLNILTDPLSLRIPWMQDLARVEAQLGIPQGFLSAPILSTRYGPLKRKSRLWVKHAIGYTASHSALGAYNRVRFVYPAPFHVNYVWSPLYVQMSHARKAILGLWHDPLSQAAYIIALKKNKYVYSVDFSGMDTAMFPVMIDAVLSALEKAGFNKATINIVREMYRTQGIILPSSEGQAYSGSFMTGAIRPWQSGWKLTSEMDTIYGLAVILSALAEQNKNIVQDWIDGKFVLAELGDDIIFSSPQPVNVEALSKSALSNWGAKLEVMEDCMFLKWMLPLLPGVPQLTRPFSRFIQQTFYNEDRYSGGPGGDKPGAILRLGIASRMVALKNHPDKSLWWPEINDALQCLVCVKDATPSWRSYVSRAEVPPVDSNDAREIQEYALRVPGYFQKINEEAKYKQSAQIALQLIKDTGSLAFLVNPSGEAIRKAYANAFASSPDLNTIKRMYVRAKEVVYGSHS